MLSPLVEFALPFAFSFLIVILVTMLAERFGTKVGGIAGTLPSTIIVAFLFIALEQGVAFATRSMTVALAEMAVNLVFLTVFAALCHHRLSLVLAVSFGVWTALTVVVYLFAGDSIVLSVVAFFASYAICLLFLERKERIASSRKIEMTYTWKKLLLRGLLAGLVIAAAVSLANIDAAISGIFAMFPAIFTSTMLISLLEHGPTFTKGLAKAMIYGSPSVAAYGIAIYLLYPSVGVVLGTVGAIAAGVIVSLSLYRFRRTIR